MRDVGRGAAHVEADHLVEAGRGRGPRHADDAARRAGQDRVLAAEARGIGQPAVGLHEQQPARRPAGRHLVDIAAAGPATDRRRPRWCRRARSA